jgi:hypothetical protein
MLLIPRKKMARGRGRPKNPDDLATRQLRVHADLAEMVAWIVRVQGGTVAQLLDPLVRPQIVARYEMLRSHIEAIQRAEAAAQAAADGKRKRPG